MKPAAFYTIEDVAAVDFKERRAYRQAFHNRWNMSPPFKQLIKTLTIFFALSTAVYVGITAAVVFSAPVQFAFGWVLGQLFMWAAWTAFICWVITRYGLIKERAWWNARRENGNP